MQGPIRNNLLAPTATISLSSSLNGNGWTNSPVTAQLHASDSGSGIDQLRYWIDDGAVNVVEGDSASLPISGEGSYVVGLRAIDNAGYVSRQATQIVKIDLHPPVVAVTGVRQGGNLRGQGSRRGLRHHRRTLRRRL